MNSPFNENNNEWLCDISYRLRLPTMLTTMSVVCKRFIVTAFCPVEIFMDQAGQG